MKKVFSWLLIAVLAIGMCAVASAEAAASDKIDFADGAYGFLGLSTAKGNADASELSVVDYNGGKALKIVSQGKVPYVAFNLEGLVGDKIADVRAISATFGVDLGADGKFYAVSGEVYTYTGADNNEAKHGWSVYLAKKNPRTIVTKLDDGEAFVAGAGNTVVFSKETDNYQTASGAPVAWYLTDIQFLDAEGNALALDLSATYQAAETGRDMSNLVALTNAVEFPGFSGISAGGWAQDGLEMPQEIIDALVPGSVVEVEFESADGTMWIVLPDAAAGWMRVGGCGNDVDAVNNSHNIAQIPYEMIVKFCGEDKATWGARMQCEAQTDWTVYAVRVGQRAHQIVLKNAVEFPGFAKSASAWAQDGLEMPQEIIDALVPGSVVEVNFESADGSMWIVLPDAAAGWSRVAQGEATIIGDKAYITYEQIVAVCGEDKATWGARMQCEAASDWSVYGVRVGQKGELMGVVNPVAFAGFDKSGSAWGQDGLEMPQEITDALVPGAVVTISYESADGTMWIVMPDSAAGWMRVGNDGADVATGSVAQITYEQIAAACGEDKATWGARMQCEAASDWHVYSVTVGQGF